MCVRLFIIVRWFNAQLKFILTISHEQLRIRILEWFQFRTRIESKSEMEAKMKFLVRWKETDRCIYRKKSKPNTRASVTTAQRYSARHEYTNTQQVE